MILALVLASAGSTVASDPLGRGTWAVDSEQDSVWLVPEKGAAQRHAVGRWPEQLVVSTDGVVFVSCRQEGRVDVIDGESLFHVTLPGEPRGLALDGPKHRLWVGLVTGHELVGVDTESLEVVERIALGAAPRAVAVNAQNIAVLLEHGGELVLFERAPSAELSWRVALPGFDEHVAWHGLALTDAGSDFAVAHTLVNTGLSRPATTGGYGGGVVVPVMVAVSMVHEGHANLVTFARTLDWRTGTTATGLQDVTGIAWREGVLALSSRGTNEVLVALAGVAPRAFVRTAVLQVGEGSSGVTFDANGELQVLAAFDRKLVRARYRSGTELRPSAALQAFGFDRPPTGLTSLAEQSLGRTRLEPQLALGRALFHRVSPNVSSAGLSCATCHADGREDGLVWRLKQSRRQTPALAGRLKDTAPYTWQGTAKTLDASIEGTVDRLGGLGLKVGERRALARYLREGMRPFSRPEPGDDPKRVALGAELFHSARTECSSCHPSDEAFTDGAAHDVASHGMKELGEMAGGVPPLLDTPSLRGVAFTAPYFHDGSAATLEQLLDENGDRMGHTTSLSDDERRALAAYLRAL